jgi:hypothetical protein
MLKCTDFLIVQFSSVTSSLLSPSLFPAPFTSYIIIHYSFAICFIYTYKRHVNNSLVYFHLQVIRLNVMLLQTTIVFNRYIWFTIDTFLIIYEC